MQNIERLAIRKMQPEGLKGLSLQMFFYFFSSHGQFIHHKRMTRKSFSRMDAGRASRPGEPPANCSFRLALPLSKK
jgi:hypothetical protein